MLFDVLNGFRSFTGLKDWEQWSYLAAIITVLVNAAFFLALIVQIRQGRKTLEESQKSTRAANDAVREARKARIDEQSPRVVALIDRPTIHGLSEGSSFNVGGDLEYVMPKMQDCKLYLISFGMLINEGRGTARVSLNGDGACFLDKEDDDPWFVTEIPSSSEQRILQPGESVRFAWSDGHTLAEWVDAYNNSYPPNPRGACFMEVTVIDYLEDGVLDNIYLEMTGRPIVPVEGDEGRWKNGVAESINSVSYPSRRTYRKEGRAEDLPLPWEASYEQWRKENDEHKINSRTDRVVK